MSHTQGILPMRMGTIEKVAALKGGDRDGSGR